MRWRLDGAAEPGALRAFAAAWASGALAAAKPHGDFRSAPAPPPSGGGGDGGDDGGDGDGPLVVRVAVGATHRARVRGGRWTLGVYYASDGDGGDGAAFVATALPALAARLVARAWARGCARSRSTSRATTSSTSRASTGRGSSTAACVADARALPAEPRPGAARRRVVFTGRPAPPFACARPTPCAKRRPTSWSRGSSATSALPRRPAATPRPPTAAL